MVMMMAQREGALAGVRSDILRHMEAGYMEHCTMGIM